MAVLASCFAGDIDSYYKVLKGCVKSAYQRYLHREGPGLYNILSEEGVGIGQMDSSESNEALLRCIVEGLFGVHPEFQKNKIIISPTFPSSWDNASIKTPDIEYSYIRTNNEASFYINGNP